MKHLLWLPALLAGLTACSPQPTTRQRVDMAVQADGHCLLERQPAECAQIGAQAASRYGAAGISAVLMVDPQAPLSSVQALRSGLQEARIGHVQYGDEAQLAQRKALPGLE